MGRNTAYAPVGTVRTVNTGRTLRKRIKVSDDGPRTRRWVNYGTWLWIQANGPVPKGHRIVHLNGDRLDDRLDNLGCVTHGDAIFLAFERLTPEQAARMRERASKHAGNLNLARAKARRLMGVIQVTLYYLVDHTARTVRGPMGFFRYQAEPEIKPGSQEIPMRGVAAKGYADDGYQVISEMRFFSRKRRKTCTKSK